MIPAINLSATEFARKDPPGDKGKASSSTAMKKAGDNLSRHSVLNDVPLAARLCLLYRFKDLKDNADDHIFPIPDAEGFEELREMKSLHAAVKQMPDRWEHRVLQHICLTRRCLGPIERRNSGGTVEGNPVRSTRLFCIALRFSSASRICGLIYRPGESLLRRHPRIVSPCSCSLSAP